MNRKKFREGLRDGLPIALGYLAVSFGIGISCHTAGISAFQGFLMSLLNNASAGEYGGITVITENSGVFMMVLMTLIINARYLLMSCALSQRLHPDTPLVHRLLIGFDVTDELFGIAIAQEGFLNVWYFFGPWAFSSFDGLSPFYHEMMIFSIKEHDFSIFAAAAVVGAVGLWANGQTGRCCGKAGCRPVGKACPFPLGGEWLFHRQSGRFP